MTQSERSKRWYQNHKEEITAKRNAMSNLFNAVKENIKPDDPVEMVNNVLNGSDNKSADKPVDDPVEIVTEPAKPKVVPADLEDNEESLNSVDSADDDVPGIDDNADNKQSFRFVLGLIGLVVSVVLIISLYDYYKNKPTLPFEMVPDDDYVTIP